MRIKLVLEVSDAARRAMACIQPQAPRTQRGHKATRTAVIGYLQERVNQLSTLAPWWDNEPLTPAEIADAKMAVELLRTQGKADGDIRAWLLLQRARYDLRGHHA
jgi:hypothetical protein